MISKRLPDFGLTNTDPPISPTLQSPLQYRKRTETFVSRQKTQDKRTHHDCWKGGREVGRRGGGEGRKRKKKDGKLKSKERKLTERIKKYTLNNIKYKTLIYTIRS